MNVLYTFVEQHNCVSFNYNTRESWDKAVANLKAFAENQEPLPTKNIGLQF